MAAAVKVLCVNAGSSSLKLAMVDARADGESRLRDKELHVTKDGGAAAEVLAGALHEWGQGTPDAIGHRLVHGGPDQVAPLRIDKDARARLERAVPFAPLHLPSELATVDAAARVYPDVPQVACFDTAFHVTLPDVARRLPIAEWADAQGVRRYGFHGLSYEYVVTHLGADVLGPAVIAHLGSGASLAAIQGGRSIDTTMGMSPTGGIMMGTRTGDLDPGALVHLLDVKKWNVRELEHFVNHECGLLGVSTTTSDMRKLLAARDSDPRARLAVDLFVYTLQKAIGALAVSLGGLGSLVFTGGIGARSSVVRAEVCARLAFLGVALDAAKNEESAAIISAPGPRCTVRVIETDEEVVIARHVRACLDPNGGG